MVKVRSYTHSTNAPVRVIAYDDHGQATDISEHYSNIERSRAISRATATLDVYRTSDGELLYDGLPNGKSLASIADYLDLVGLACDDAVTPSGTPRSFG